jgi:hypothetical protein
MKNYYYFAFKYKKNLDSFYFILFRLFFGKNLKRFFMNQFLWTWINFTIPLCYSTFIFIWWWNFLNAENLGFESFEKIGNNFLQAFCLNKGICYKSKKKSSNVKSMTVIYFFNVAVNMLEKRCQTKMSIYIKF